MRFQVPQFIEVEDKIFGPLTFKQFIYVAGGGGIVAVLFTFLPKFLAFLIAIPVAMLAAGLAFYKVNDRPFALLVEDFFKFHTGSKLYIWKKTDNKKPEGPLISGDKPLEQVYVPKLSGSKLKDLTFQLDVKQQNNPVTEERK
ncbi:PrgI family protein [Candidatus Parcubacteria bacterium]|nr:PrgI family protein [Candidatus Parcubacteria bacterium]